MEDIPDLSDYNYQDGPAKRPPLDATLEPVVQPVRHEPVSDWATARVCHKYPVDSVDLYASQASSKHADSSGGGGGRGTSTASRKANSPVSPRRPHSEQQSPYLTIPVPPPHLTVLQVGEYFFREVDRRGGEVLSHSYLVQALRDNPDVVKVGIIYMYHACKIICFRCNSSQRLRLSSQFRQEDGSMDPLVNCFRAMDSHGDGDITLDEFLAFLRDNSEEFAPSQPHSHSHSGRKDASPERRVESRQSSVENFDPVRVSTASDDIIGGSRYHSRIDEDGDEMKGDEPRGEGKHDETGSISRVSSPHISQHTRLPDRDLPSDPAWTGRSRPMAASYDPSMLLRDGRDDLQGRPPLYRTMSANTAQGHLVPSVGASVDGSADMISPPLPSDLGAAMSVILEGWLEKKSTNLGQWQKVYPALVKICIASL